MEYLKSVEYYLFGAGSTSMVIKSTLEKQNKKVVAFLTSNGNNTSSIGNIEIIDISNDSGRIDTSIPVIISVFNREFNAHPQFITKFLNQYGINKIITLYEFYTYFSDSLENWYWLTDNNFYKQHANEYQMVRSLLTDFKSIDTFDRIINFLYSFDLKVLPTVELENQYFLPDINIWDCKGAFLDIGSFDGQTILDAYKNFGKMKTAIAYEPDPQNIKLIKNKIKGLNIADQIFFIPCGVWSKTELLKFSSGGGESSAIKAHGDIMIQCLSLDETLLNVEIGYIKMDIEGAEMEALIGAEKIIKKYKPTLAICLYHKPDHLFAIPLLIHSYNSDYKFAVRSHGNNLFDTVLYCY
jgi:FkbM family methyltransferase